MSRVRPETTLDWLTSQVRTLLVNDGIFLTVATIGTLGLTGALLNDWAWSADEIRGLPVVEDSEGRDFYYKRQPGGRFVIVFLPTGRRVRHAITPRASADDEQLAAEVHALVADNYPPTT